MIKFAGVSMTLNRPANTLTKGRRTAKRYGRRRANGMLLD